MQTILQWFRTRPLRMIGGLLVFLTTGSLLFLVLLDIVVGFGNPYLGILVYMVLPFFLILGLILVPLDSWIYHRRIARGKPPYPVINLDDPRQRKIAGFFAIASVLILIVMTVVTFKAAEYMNTKAFCGTTCHLLMIPEYTAYQQSAHANVLCVGCHIGPGATWYVRAKLSGVPQVWHYAVGDYPRPIPTPVRALRPSRDTCEQCHWPEQFYGDTLNTKITYLQDRENTRQVNTMIMHVGSGGIAGSGIHSHIVGKVIYIPAVEKFTEIAWVRVERADGTTREFVNPLHQNNLNRIRNEHPMRLMDCIDCHNRAAHDFESFETNLDTAITARRVDPGLPFIKRQAMQAVGSPEKVPTEAEYARTISRIRDISTCYQQQLPDVYRTQSADIRRSVRAITDAYKRTYFPHMRVGPGTYPQWRTHEGCFRCHGVLISASPGGGDRNVSADCNLCHEQQASNLSPM